MRVPFGVVGIIYEARPNVTADAAGICLKSGNAALLRGSSSAAQSNAAIVDRASGRSGHAESTGRGGPAGLGPAGGTTELMAARGLVDVLIPRGGAGLIDTVVRNSQVPVIETGVGNCHLYVDASADGAMALDILLNAKTQRPSVCNSGRNPARPRRHRRRIRPQALGRWLRPASRCTAETGSPGTVRRLGSTVVEARRPTSPRSTSPLDIAVAVVDSLDGALAHIRQLLDRPQRDDHYRVPASAQRFIAEVDAAAVLVNASSRFVDGGEFGFGAEIGISTQKLHARGPMGLPEMTSTKYVVTGAGQTRR